MSMIESKKKWMSMTVLVNEYLPPSVILVPLSSISAFVLSSSSVT